MRLLFMVYRFCRSTTLVIVCADCDARGVGWEFGWGCIGWLLLPKCQAECLERLRVHRAKRCRIPDRLLLLLVFFLLM